MVLETAMLVASVVELALAAYGVTVNSLSDDAKIKLNSTATSIAKAIAKNSTLLDQLQTAYDTKNADLANSLLRGAGFGPRIDALKVNSDKLNSDYSQDRSKINRSTAKLNSDYTKTQNAYNNTNTIFGSKNAKDVADDPSTKAHVSAAEDLQQNIKGGIING